MKKNPNKTAGNWGALKNKPQNEVYFKTGGKVKVTAGGEKHVIYKKTTKRGEGKVGNIMVNHPTKDKGIWDTIDLTKKSGAKTIKQGIASTKKWHKENPYNDMKKQVAKKQAGGMITQMRRKRLTNKYNKLSDKLIPYKNSPINPILMSEDYLSDDPAKVKAYEAAEKVDNKETKKFLRAANAQGRVTNKMDKIDIRNSFKKKGGSIKKYQRGGKTATIPSKLPGTISVGNSTAYRDSLSEEELAQLDRDLAAFQSRNDAVLKDRAKTRANGKRVVVQKTRKKDVITRTKQVYNPKKEELTTKTKSYDAGNRRYTLNKTKSTVSTKPTPKYYNTKPAPATKPMPYMPDDAKPTQKAVPLEGGRKNGGSVKKYQTGGKVTTKSKSLDPVKRIDTFKKGNALSTGVYKSNPADKAKGANTMKDWAKKEKQVTNPKNRPAGSPVRQLQKGGSIKKYQAGGATKDSTSYFKADKDLYYKQAATNAKYGLRKEADEMMKKAGKAAQNELRQKNKGRLGYDKNGYPLPTPVTPKGVANAVTKAAKRTAQAVSKKKK